MIENLIMRDLKLDEEEGVVMDYVSYTMVTDCSTFGYGTKLSIKENGEALQEMFAVGAIFKSMNMSNESFKENWCTCK